MARVVLSYPDEIFRFTTEMPVRITDINGANHLGNDALISMLSEARAQYMVQVGLQEMIENGVGIVVTDLATMYQSESFFPEILSFEVGVTDLNRYGGDYAFRVSKAKSGQPVALAKYGFVFFNFREKKVVPMPDRFREALS